MPGSGSRSRSRRQLRWGGGSQGTGGRWATGCSARLDPADPCLVFTPPLAMCLYLRRGRPDFHLEALVQGRLLLHPQHVQGGDGGGAQLGGPSALQLWGFAAGLHEGLWGSTATAATARLRRALQLPPLQLLGLRWPCCEVLQVGCEWTGGLVIRFGCEWTGGLVMRCMFACA